MVLVWYSYGAGAVGAEHSEAPARVHPPGARRTAVDAILTPMVAHLPAIVATLTTANPGAACRIARGAALVAAGAVERVHNVWLVTSASTPNRAYGVIRLGALLTCDCPDYRERGGPCKHGWATVIYQAAERLDAEQSDPTLQPIGYALTPRAYTALADVDPVPAA